MGIPACYVSGSRIRAARGDVEIDTITVGEDVVVIRDGEETLEPVERIGCSNVDIARHPHPEQAAPVRVRQGAIAENQPSRDLLLSPEHCLFIDGRRFPVNLLVNGGSIASERDRDQVTYYHLELERHGILLAENTPSESYLDTGDRSLFDNAGETKHLRPGPSGNFTAERRQTDACAPLARVPEDVEPVWTRLAERSPAIGYPVPAVRTVDDPDIHLLADGRTLRPLSGRDSRYVFMVPAGVAAVSLVSRFCVQSDETVPGQRDARRLGVSVNWIAIRGDGEETILPADHPGLVKGWNPAETDGVRLWRWTDGAASIPWDNATGPAVVTVRCVPVDAYPVRDGKDRLVA